RDLERRVVVAEQPVRDDQVARAADRQELGQAFDHPEHEAPERSRAARGVRVHRAASGSTYSRSNASATARCVTLPASTLAAVRSAGSSSALRTPTSASRRTQDAVAFVSANVEVRGTAPGMFATQ